MLNIWLKTNKIVAVGQLLKRKQDLDYFFVPSIYSLTAEYLVPNTGTAVWLLYIISQLYADAIYIFIIIEAVVTYYDWV